MSINFQNILTTIGQQKKAAAEAGGAALNITSFKVGDSNGSYYTPAETQINLVNAKYTGSFTDNSGSQIVVNQSALNEVLYKCYIPANIGGFTIRELGLFDDSNKLILICKIPAQDKFDLTSGLYQPLTFTPRIVYTNPQTQAVLTPSSLIISTQTYVNQQITNISQQFNDGLSSHETDTQAHISLFNLKQNNITGGASSITSSNLNTSKALVSDANGKVATSSVTSAELGYVSGVTSALQTQINLKANQSDLTTTNTNLSSHLTDNNAHSSLFAQKANISGSSGQVFNVANATQYSNAVPLGQLNTFLNFIPYSVNSGAVDVNGYANFITKVDNATAKIAATTTPIVLTYPDGTQETISADTNVGSLTLGNPVFVKEKGNPTIIPVKIGYYYSGLLPSISVATGGYAISYSGALGWNPYNLINGLNTGVVFSNDNGNGNAYNYDHSLVGVVSAINSTNNQISFTGECVSALYGTNQLLLDNSGNRGAVSYTFVNPTYNIGNNTTTITLTGYYSGVWDGSGSNYNLSYSTISSGYVTSAAFLSKNIYTKALSTFVLSIPYSSTIASFKIQNADATSGAQVAISVSNDGGVTYQTNSIVTLSTGLNTVTLNTTGNCVKFSIIPRSSYWDDGSGQYWIHHEVRNINISNINLNFTVNLAGGTITESATAPATPAIGDYWLNIGIKPYQPYKYSNSAWVPMQFVKLGEVTIASATFTGNTTSASPIITNIPSTSGFIVGTAITGSGIPAGATISSIDSSSQIHISANATATATGVTITYSAMGTPVNYAFNGKFTSLDTACTAVGIATVFNHNIGTRLIKPPVLQLRCITSEYGYLVGDIVFPTGSGGTYTYPNGIIITGINTLQNTTGSSSAYAAGNKTTGAGVNLTAANWKQFVTAERNF